MSRFSALQRQIDEFASIADILSKYRSCMGSMNVSSSDPFEPYYCSGAVNFVISFMIFDRNIRKVVMDIQDKQSKENSRALNASTCTSLGTAASTLNSATGYIILLNTRKTDDVGHTFCILIDRNTSDTHQWCLYQANATGNGDFKKFTISPKVNRELKQDRAPARNRPMSPIATLTPFLQALTRANDRPPEFIGCRTTEWNFKVVDFSGNIVLGNVP